MHTHCNVFFVNYSMQLRSAILCIIQISYLCSVEHESSNSKNINELFKKQCNAMVKYIIEDIESDLSNLDILDKDKFVINTYIDIIDTIIVDSSIYHIYNVVDSTIEHITAKVDYPQGEEIYLNQKDSLYSLRSTGIAISEILAPYLSTLIYLIYKPRISILVDNSIKLENYYNPIKDIAFKKLNSKLNQLQYLNDYLPVDYSQFDDIITIESADLVQSVNDFELTRSDIYKNSWAVIIGIDKYKYSKQLNYAVKDAEAVKDILINKFDYPEENIRYLTDEKATLSEIKLALDDISTTAGENDRVLVFYSGHGETIRGIDGAEKGYIIPYEGRQNKAYATGLAMDEILTTSMMSPSKHMLFLMDACYSGLMTESVKGLEKSQDKGYLSKVANEKARQIITAGGSDEQVIERDEWQHSAFTKNLLAGLETWEADFNDDGYVTADELSSYLRETVTEDSDYQQTPQDGRFKNSGGGEFVFFGTGDKISQDEIIIDNDEIKPSIPPLYWDNHPLGFNISALTGGMNVKSIGKMTLLSSYLGASYTFNDFVFDFGYEHSKNITSNFAFTSNAIFIEYVDAIAIVHSIIPSGNYLYSSLGFNIENITYIDDITNYKSEDVGVIPKVGLVWGWHWFEKGGMRWDGVINANLGYAINDLTNAAGEKYYNGLIIELGLAMTY